MNTLFNRGVGLFGTQVRLVGVQRPMLSDVTGQNVPEASPPPPPGELVRNTPGFQPPAYPGRSAFSGPCPVCH